MIGAWALLAATVLVAGPLLLHLLRARTRLRRGLALLASWPLDAGDEPAAPVGEALRNAARILGVPRALLVWEDEEEPWLELALLSPDGLKRLREAPGAYEPLVAPELAGVSFLASKTGGPLRPRDAVHPELVERFRMDTLLALRLGGRLGSARLFALDRPDFREEDLLLGEAVAGMVGAHLGQLRLAAELEETAAAAARIRVARDLHDGILQDLAGVALQLEALRPLLRDSSEALRRVESLQRVLEAEQHDVRTVIDQLRPTSSSRHEFDLDASLEELKESLAATWGLALELTSTLEGRSVAPRVRYELYRIVREAVSNAARHARASRVEVSLRSEGAGVAVRVADDGRGFPFSGRYDLAELNKMRLGPVTLKERIAALGGSLVLESTPSGSTLEIRVPLDRPR